VCVNVSADIGMAATVTARIDRNGARSMNKPVTIAELQKEQPRTFETTAKGKNLEKTKMLLTEAGATISKTVRIESRLARIYLRWPSYEH